MKPKAKDNTGQRPAPHTDDIDFGDLDFGLDERKEVLKGGGEAARKQISEVLKRFAERKKAEKATFWDNVDSEYWFCLCFQSRAQKEDFLRAMKWDQYGDKYLDGAEIARAMGVKISGMPRIPKTKHHKSWEEFVKKS